MDWLLALIVVVSIFFAPKYIRKIRAQKKYDENCPPGCISGEAYLNTATLLYQRKSASKLGNTTEFKRVRDIDLEIASSACPAIHEYDGRKMVLPELMVKDISTRKIITCQHRPPFGVLVYINYTGPSSSLMSISKGSMITCVGMPKCVDSGGYICIEIDSSLIWK